MENRKIDQEQAVIHLMDLLAAEGPSGGEGPVSDMVKQKLLAAGCKPQWMRHAGLRRLPPGFTTGNLIVKIPGTVRAPRILFCAHLDTVPICCGAVPARKGNRIVPKGNTGLGGDDRAAVAALVTMADALLANNLPRPPVTLLFTVGEENGLHGTKAFEPSEGGHPAMCFNLDGSGRRGGVIGALGAVRWQAEIVGKSVHAAVHPEGGVSAAVIAANALAELKAQGWFGRIQKRSCAGTANAGTLHGGEADNQVMDRLVVTGECRSHSPAALRRIEAAWQAAFEKAARGVRNDQGECGSVRWTGQNDYSSFRLRKTEPAVKRFVKAARREGLTRPLEIINAGLDANILHEKGIPTVTFGAGNFNAHSLDEYVSIPDYLQACRIAVALAVEDDIPASGRRV